MSAPDKYEHIDGPFEDGDYAYTGTVEDYTDWAPPQEDE